MITTKFKSNSGARKSQGFHGKRLRRLVTSDAGMTVGADETAINGSPLGAWVWRSQKQGASGSATFKPLDEG
jgi:hypothetical protein